MPYRIDIREPFDDALDRLLSLGALDVGTTEHGIAAILPDAVVAETVAGTLGVSTVTTSAAEGRDDGSVWVLDMRPVHVGRLVIAPADAMAGPNVIRLVDSAAFGTGLHPTTALCLEALQDLVAASSPSSVLDIGTGSGILAIAALLQGVPHAVGLDIDREALTVAGTNARLNGVEDRLHLLHGEPPAIDGVWPVVFANVLAAPLIEMAPAIVSRVAGGGRLILSGIPAALEGEVWQAYRRCGMRLGGSAALGGWTALVLSPSW